MNNGRYDWSRFGRLLVNAEPSSNLRCNLLGGAIEIEGGGYEPFFMLGASAKLGPGQWQDTTRDPLGVPLPPREGLERTEGIVDILVRLAEFSYYQGADIQPQGLFQHKFDERTLDSVLDGAARVLNDHVGRVGGLLEALRHLMDNAVRHSGQSQGVLTLSTSGNSILVRVEDQGVGIDHTVRLEYPWLAVAGRFQLPGAPRPSGLQAVLAFAAETPRVVVNLHSGDNGYVAMGGQEYDLLSRGSPARGVIVELLIAIAHTPGAG